MRLRGAMRRVWNYVAYERNPLTPLLYVSLMVGCKFFFIQETYHHVPNKYVHAHHKWVAAALYITCFALYIYMCRSDPGVVTAATIDSFHVYPSQPVLYPENKFCRTCKTLKLPRSKHCRICNHCVARFDHHSCVGAHNYGGFIAFLIVQLALCVEVFYITSSVFFIQSEAIAGDNSDETFRQALHSVIANNQPLGFVAAVSIMIAVVVWFFLLVQLQRIVRNVTANETFKRDALRIAADPDNASGAKKLFHLLVATLPGPPGAADNNMDTAKPSQDLDTSWGGLFSPDTILNTEEKFTVADVDFNPYNLGSLWQNIKDAFQGKRKNNGKQKTKKA